MCLEHWSVYVRFTWRFINVTSILLTAPAWLISYVDRWSHNLNLKNTFTSLSSFSSNPACSEEKTFLRSLNDPNNSLTNQNQLAGLASCEKNRWQKVHKCPLWNLKCLKKYWSLQSILSRTTDGCFLISRTTSLEITALVTGWFGLGRDPGLS